MTVAAVAPVVFDVVVRISIVLDQCAAVIIAGELNSVWVNGRHGSEEGVSIVDNDRLFLVISSSGDLRVGPGFNVCVASDQGKFNVVRVIAGCLSLVVLPGILLLPIVVIGSKMLILSIVVIGSKMVVWLNM